MAVWILNTILNLFETFQREQFEGVMGTFWKQSSRKSLEHFAEISKTNDPQSRWRRFDKRNLKLWGGVLKTGHILISNTHYNRLQDVLNREIWNNHANRFDDWGFKNINGALWKI